MADSGDESQLWENEFLQESDIKESFSSQAVVLRIEAGSTEAGYLAAIYPLPKTPTFVVIKNGELKEYLAAGVSRDDFMSRLRKALGANASQAVASTAQSSSSASHSSDARTTAPSEPAQEQTTRTTTSSTSTPASNQPDSAVHNLLAERSARLEAQRKEQDAKDRAKRQAEAAERQKKLEEAAVPNSSASADMKYALMEKKRQQEAKAERARILQRVEDDKAARRAKAAQQKVQSQAVGETSSAAAAAAASTTIQSSSSSSTKKAPSSSECALQIRLFDGTTIRSRFPSSATLSHDVRPWIDSQAQQKANNDQPYTFKQVLSPLPNKNIETSEEERTLDSLDLSPSATLILLPITGYTSAYTAGGAGTGLVSAGVGLVSSGIGMASRMLGGFFAGGDGGGGAAAPSESAEGSRTPSAVPSSGINVRTLRDQEDEKMRRDKQQFYNGNATNFEPRKDEDDGKEE